MYRRIMSYSLVFTFKVQTTKEMENTQFSNTFPPLRAMFEKSSYIANAITTQIHTHKKTYEHTQICTHTDIGMVWSDDS